MWQYVFGVVEQSEEKFYIMWEVNLIKNNCDNYCHEALIAVF